MVYLNKVKFIAALCALLLCCCSLWAGQTSADDPAPRYRNPFRAMSERSSQPVNIRISSEWQLTDAQRRTAMRPPVMKIDAYKIRFLYPEDLEPTPEQVADGSALTRNQRKYMQRARRAALREAIWRVSVEAEAYNRVHSEKLAAIEKQGRHIIINLTEQRGYYMEGSQQIRTFRVCSGKRSTPTPTGHFHIQEKDRHHRSNLYHASMPFFMRLTLDGVGLHQGPIRGYPSSHGCIRLYWDDARFLFERCEVGTAVFVIK
ncbi:MAG: L,D-transpeptidase [Akkermansia sp.]|nr:L,D-transpeptidase [Akkermansia sp.]